MQIPSQILHFPFQVENTSPALSSLTQTKGYLQTKKKIFILLPGCANNNFLLVKRKEECNTQKANYATAHTGENTHCHNNIHRESDERKSKNMNTHNTDPTDHHNKLLALA